MPEANACFPFQITENPLVMIAHGSSVAFEGRAVMFHGPSGSGKSGLCLELMAFGCTLVADDRVKISQYGSDLMLSAPAQIAGMIEARGLGVLSAVSAATARLVLAVDLGAVETERMPHLRPIDVMGISIPQIHKIESYHFAASILQYLKTGNA